jgi:peroxiredoxin Q/BCP
MPAPEPLSIGQVAPVFTYPLDGENHRSDKAEGFCLLYFYPKDDTPGCTTQACSFRDQYAALRQAGVQIVGVSKDPESSHEKFRAKYELPFPLIADTDLTLANAYGVFGEKKFMGRIYDGVHRMSFLIAPDGTITKTYPKVKPADHAAEILRDVASLK